MNIRCQRKIELKYVNKRGPSFRFHLARLVFFCIFIDWVTNVHGNTLDALTLRLASYWCLYLNQLSERI